MDDQVTTKTPEQLAAAAEAKAAKILKWQMRLGEEGIGEAIYGRRGSHGIIPEFEEVAAEAPQLAELMAQAKAELEAVQLQDLEEAADLIEAFIFQEVPHKRLPSPAPDAELAEAAKPTAKQTSTHGAILAALQRDATGQPDDIIRVEQGSKVVVDADAQLVQLPDGKVALYVIYMGALERFYEV
jgi:hypothetical protein